jgi:hypothetical protein
MSDFTVYKPRNGQILKKGRVMSASDLAVELTQLQATNERLTAERDEMAAHHESLMLASWELKEGKPDAYYKVKSCRSTLAKDILAIRDLEQQAKGVDRVLELQAYSCMNESAIMAQDIHGLLASLRNQAKQAKEKG